jgi:hypothetical protein
MSESEKLSPAERADDTKLEKTMSAIESVVRVLGPLSQEERQRVVQGALVVLGDFASVNISPPGSYQTQGGEVEPSVPINPHARLWMKQNHVDVDELVQVYDISDSGVIVIAAGVTGSNTAEKVIKAYTLIGVGSLLATGEPSIIDRDARALCAHLGCYDSTNHSKYVKERGNYFVGSKDAGWKLTAPGLKFGAETVKELTSV